MCASGTVNFERIVPNKYNSPSVLEIGKKERKLHIIDKIQECYLCFHECTKIIKCYNCTSEICEKCVESLRKHKCNIIDDVYTKCPSCRQIIEYNI